MSANYTAPGVYIEEIASGSRPIEAVGTSTVGFIGAAPKADAHRGEAFPVTNWLQFVKEFVKEGSRSTPLAQAAFGFFQNSNGLCYIVNIGENDAIAGGEGGRRSGLQLFEEIDEIAIVAAPGYTDQASHAALIAHCEKMRDRFAVLDAPRPVMSSKEPKKETAPTVEETPAASSATPPAAPPSRKESARETGTAASPLEHVKKSREKLASANGFGAYYFPWIQIQDPLMPKETVWAPPSGHIAGIYARVDGTRGVHKAPANEIIRGAIDLEYRVTQEEQQILNPMGVNCIRFFPGQGIRVWGARTLATDANWRYINVRRLFNMIEESIAAGTHWVVFEPNDATLWNAIKRDVSAFLTRLWRLGALMGKTPEEAFFVKCDEETNTPEEISAGRVVTIIGVAPVKPAEFVVFKIGQTENGSKVE